MSREFSTDCGIDGIAFILSTFGDRLKEAFGTTEISKIADKLGVTYQAAKNYVDGRWPSAEKLIDISRSTNCSLDWLLTGEGNKQLRVEKVFDLEYEIEKSDDWLDVMRRWYEFDGADMPDFEGAAFMQGWNGLTLGEKADALRDVRKLLDRLG